MNASTHLQGSAAQPLLRHDWTRAEITALLALPFSDLMFQAQSVHRAHFNPNEVQVSTLCSIKTGACPEDCAYCPQSARYDTGLEREKLMAVINDQNASDEERFAARLQFQQLPRNASPVRLVNRCSITGRGRGVYRKFGLGRIKLRELAFKGEVPGMVKASW